MALDCYCLQDGFCQRYQRQMVGREREICRGENVDVGTALALRSGWLNEASNRQERQPLIKRCPHLGEHLKTDAGENEKREGRQCFNCLHPARAPQAVTMIDCQECDHRPRDNAGARRLLLRNHLSPGDVLVMSAAIQSLHRAHPCKFVTAVETSADQLFEFNPDVTPAGDGFEPIEMHYPAIHKSDQRGVHFMQGYCEHLEQALGVPVPLATNRPHVYLSRQEKNWMSQVQEITKKPTRFWVICAGRKSDYTAKFWGTENYQAVVNALRGQVLFVQVGATEHHHPPLKNVINLVGKTDMRQLVRLIWHADGVLCGVTLLEHLAAALEKPAVVIMGGREPVMWNTYPRQQLMHTVGALPCCRNGGCWKSRVTPLNDGSEQDSSLCENPVPGDEVIGKCMTLISPREVADKISVYA